MSTHKSSRFSIPKREKSINVHIWKRCDLEVFFQFGKFRYEATLGQIYSRIKERIPEIYVPKDPSIEPDRKSIFNQRKVNSLQYSIYYKQESICSSDTLYYKYFTFLINRRIKIEFVNEGKISTVTQI